jgi:hypothetical protein
MIPATTQIFRKGAFFSGLMMAAILCAQEVPTSPDWQLRWVDLASREDLTEEQRLLEQTELAREMIQSDSGMDLVTWERIADLLRRWENSPSVPLAREAYFSLLTLIGDSRLGSDTPFPDEAGLREFFQKALMLTQTLREEGRFLHYLAESSLRSVPDSAAALRRVESLLLQAAAVIDEHPPRDAIHFRLGQLYYSMGIESSGAEGEITPAYFTQAVFHFRQVAEVEGASEELKEQAQSALLDLLKPELEFQVNHRYLPHNDIRISIRSRNLETLSVEMVGLLPGELTATNPLEKLRDKLLEEDPLPERILHQRQISLGSRYLHDWQKTDLRLGENFVSGWYGLKIQGESLIKRDLLLVTPLEVVAFLRDSGELLIWAGDVETGQPLKNAEVSVFGPDGEVLAQELADDEGFALLLEEEASGWSEIQVRWMNSFGYFRKEDLPVGQARIPWVIANPAELQAGDRLQWSIVGLDNSIPPEFDPSPHLTLPDGRMLEAEVTGSGPGWLSGHLDIPETNQAGGPVHVLLPGEQYLMISHVRGNTAFPLRLEISGDRLDGALNLFHAANPLGLRVYPVLGMASDLPEFIRLRVIKLNRRPLVSSIDHLTISEDSVLDESILAFEETDQSGIFLELPEIAVSDELLPLRVQILGLKGSEVLGEVYLGLAPFRRVVRLDLSQKIVLPGESVDIRLKMGDDSPFADFAMEGTLVIYRETWESRYIHRKRGNPISEAEYLALPDRSLLGAAKTDYRLLEQGFVREEVRRIPLSAEESQIVVPVRFDRPGYYNIEFDGRDNGIRPEYTNEALEVWVLPTEADGPPLRSDKPRLIVDKNGDGSIEILVLLDRPGVGILLDLIGESGPSRTQIHQPETASLFLRIPSEAALSTIYEVCRVFIVGELRTDFLSEAVGDSPSPEWVLESNSLFGLNPGVPFEWSFRTSGDSAMESILWTFYPDSANALTPTRLKWQQALRSSAIQTSTLSVAHLGQQLPLSHPFLETVSVDISPDTRIPLTDPAHFMALYPEVIRYPEALPDVVPFQPVYEGADEHTFTIAGNFPNVAGRWHLTLFGATGADDLETHSWLLSTELPIRSTLEGPSILRIADHVSLPLSLENTTRDRVNLTLKVGASDAFQADPAQPVEMLLSPSQRDILPVGITALKAGDHLLSVALEGGGISSEAIHELKVMPDPSQVDFQFHLVPPQEALVEASLDLTGWSTGKAVVASGLGSLLPEVWPAIRDSQGKAEPLLRVLGDWAMWRVYRHHGVIEGGNENPFKDILIRELTATQAASGGWGVVPGDPGKPWFSSLVLWALEVFARQDDQAFSEVRPRARTYLESILIDETIDTESRLFALRALAAPSFHATQIRPSRIQARSFLDFLQRRSELKDLEVALLLQVAKAYRFREEIGLLSGELENRLLGGPPGESARFWAASLRYLALEDRENGVSSSQALLLEALNALGETGPRRDWKQVAGFLNLLSIYFWKGDFFQDGRVEVSLDGSSPQSLSLNPEIASEGLLFFDLSEERPPSDRLDLALDTSSALSPVIVAGIATVKGEPQAIAVPGGVRMQIFREYSEETLLKGPIVRSDEISEDLSGIRVGDTLRLVFDFALTGWHPIADLRFPIPAGLVFSGNPVEHVWTAPGGVVDQPPSVVRESSSPGEGLFISVRLEPVPAGKHRFSVTLKAMWPGTFQWPAPSLVLPREGISYELSPSRSLMILPEWE